MQERPVEIVEELVEVAGAVRHVLGAERVEDAEHDGRHGDHHDDDGEQAAEQEGEHQTGAAQRCIRSPGMAARIAVLPGDGIGPEITAPTLALLDRLGDFTFEEHPFGGAWIDAHGAALTDETLDACRAADAVLLAAVGGPKWDTTDPAAPRPEQGLLGLRQALGLYANLRPVRAIDALLDASPLRREVMEGCDMLVVRELTGGIYFGAKERTDDRA